MSHCRLPRLGRFSFGIAGRVLAMQLLACVAIASPALGASPFVLDFEGLGVLQNGPAVFEGVGDFYNGGTGDAGSGPGQNFGVEFSDNALAIVDADAVGLTPISGNFGGEPSPDTVLFFLTGSAATMTFRDGFTDGFSFFYSSINFQGSIVVYSGPEATGNVLATLVLPQTPFNGAPDPTGQFSPFVPIGVAFDGVAQSIDFGGTINQIGFDNITFGSETPIVPEPVSAGLLTAGLVGLSAFGRGSGTRLGNRGYSHWRK